MRRSSARTTKDFLEKLYLPQLLPPNIKNYHLTTTKRFQKEILKNINMWSAA